MPKIIVVLPTQLFKNPELIPKRSKDTVYIVEHPLYFSSYPYHKLKLIMHRATMKAYFDYVKDALCVSNVSYVDHKDYKDFAANLRRQGGEVVMYDPVDHTIYAEFHDLSVKYADSPMFYCSRDSVYEYYAKHKRFNWSEFYTWQRTRQGIMVDEKGKPWGGEWAYENETRKPFPKDLAVDLKIVKNQSPYVSKAVDYVETCFAYNIGSTKYYLPVNFKEAEEFFESFLTHRFKLFQPHQDAVDPDVLVGSHSLLSPILNIGLLTPRYVVGRAVEYYKDNSKGVSLQALEGFVRQVVGWREYVRMVYVLEPIKLSEVNYYSHTRKLSNGWYVGDTGIPPIDAIIKKFVKIGYAHHNERLMYLGNMLFLLRTDPKEVYNYFMMFIDAYPWVMESNVFGLSQQSSGKLMMRKPYLSASNVVLTMSSYGEVKDSSSRKVCKKDWWEIWDALYFTFVNDNKVALKGIMDAARQEGDLEQKGEDELKEMRRLAEEFMDNY